MFYGEAFFFVSPPSGSVSVVVMYQQGTPVHIVNLGRVCLQRVACVALRAARDSEASACAIAKYYRDNSNAKPTKLENDDLLVRYQLIRQNDQWRIVAIAVESSR